MSLRGQTPAPVAAESLRAVAPVVEAAPGYRLLIAVPGSAPALDAREAASAMQRACRDVQVATFDPDTTGSERTTTSAAADSDLAVVVGSPIMQWVESCAASWDNGPDAIRTGLSFGRIMDPGAVPVHVALLVNGDTVAPAQVASRPAFAVLAAGWIPSGARLDARFPIAAIAPRAGAWPSVSVVVRESGGMYATVDVRDAQALALDLQYLRWRVGADSALEGEMLHIHPRRRPSAAMQGPLAAAAAGHLGVAAIQSLHLLGDRVLLPTQASDPALAKLLIAAASFASGDSALAVAMVRAAQLGHPCLQAPEGFSAAIQRIAAAIRPKEQCALVAPRTAFFRNMIAPGSGHLMMRHRGAAIAGASMVFATAAFGGYTLHTANVHYQNYRGVTNYAVAAAAWERANQLRASARRDFTIAGAVWVGEACWGWLAARHFNRGVVDDRL